MAELYYENQGNNTFLVYEIREDDVVDNMSLGMLTNNAIDGFAQTLFTQMDDRKFIKFNVSAKVSASQLFDGPVNKKRLVGVFSGIVSAMITAEEYMLDPAAILLNMDYIFVDVSTYETALICLPVTDLSVPPSNLAAFFKNIIFNTQFDQSENGDYVAQILSYLNSNQVLSLEGFKDLLEGLLNTKQIPVKVAQTKVQPEAPRNIQQNHCATPKTPEGVNASAPLQAQVQNQGVQQPVNQQTKIAMPETNKADHTEQNISLFYLLQHYNKENAAAYKAQKEARKAQKANGNAKKENNPGSISVNPGYAVPGQQSAGTNFGFAIPNQQVPTAEQKPVQQVQATVYQTSSTQNAAPINFGETTVLGGGQIGETTVLGAESNPTRVDPHLIRMKNNEKIPLNKPVFRIGKERSYVDYFIGDNTAISRSHANIVNHNGEFYVVDTNSTNHTYVNGGMIQSNVETKLSHGTKIRLANEDFEFRLY